MLDLLGPLGALEAAFWMFHLRSTVGIWFGIHVFFHKKLEI